MRPLAIVCGAPSSEMSAPFDDDNYDVWVLGNRCERYPRYTRIFEIHDHLSDRGPEYPQWLVDKGVPLVVGEKFPLSGENIKVFPYAEATELYGSLYLTSSSACMLALALLEGYDHIELYGVDMAVDDHEYFWQRPCMESWIGFAKGRGVTLVIPEDSPIGRSDYVEGRDYGSTRPSVPFVANEYADMAQTHADKIEALTERYSAIQAAKAEAEQIEALIRTHSGAQQAYERMAKVQRAIEAGNDIKTLKDTVVIR